ncbi:MAG: hypothetical protein ABSA77_09050, partial [Thermoguttaceae bacterium]
MTWTLIFVQAILPVAQQALAETITATPLAPAAAPRATPPAAPVVKVNRTVPNVKPPSLELQFSASPADQEISSARVFGGPIISLGKTVSPTENKDLAAALLAYRNRQDPDDASAIETFLQAHPDSPRRISLVANLTSHYHRTCQFSKALEACRQVWASGKDVADINGRQVVDQAVGEWASLLVTMGKVEELKALLRELNGRGLHGSAAVRISDAQSALWQMERYPGQSFRCGPFSLSRIQAALNPSAQNLASFLSDESTTNGTSLYQNLLLAQGMGLKYQMARRQPGAEIPLPAMAHWNLGHFSALIQMQNGHYRIEDPAFQQGWVSPKVLDAESDCFLIPAGSLPAGWSPVAEEEGKTIFGKCVPNSSDAGAGGGDSDSGPPPAGGGGGAGGRSNDKGCPPAGMPQYTFNTMRIGLEVADVPLGYTPPLGPEIEFRITYSEKTIFQTGPFSYSNLGNQWTYEWLTYISDDTTKPNADVNIVVNNGNSVTFTGYNPSTGTYAVQYQGQAQLTKTSGTSYQCLYPNGSMKFFSQPDTTNGPRRVFLTKMQDPAGNALTFTYDSYFRMIAVRDAIGQVTTITNELSDNPADSRFYKITRVTDPFTRYATFTYNASGQLTNITDEIGISSSFAYGATNEADFINAMTTPYGTTTFANNNADYTNFSITNIDLSRRWIQATDPLGGQERMEFSQTNGVNIEDPGNLVPSGLVSDYRNRDLSIRMSFFWNKKNMQAMQGRLDYNKARQYVWDRAAANYYMLSRTLESIRQPMESARVWYNYPGQQSCFQEGTMNTPTIIARVLDDGTTQMQQYQYNAIGKPVLAIDPAGRTTLFTYASNNIDLLTVAQLAAGQTNVLAQYTYNSQHLPLTAVDAAGNTNCFGYNTNGQLTALTNALGQVVAVAYDTNGYLTGIAGPLGMTNGFTYDGLGRVRTVTDSEGYTITASYDNL